ncbi:hypothetical protein HRI_002279700 [Hibiscus trionum]|uniref:BED-type domain-containing protein n=1 Tax=Hibiscus trionum TaxID=183268 RepID=A0A9W7M309_HIBTR|nr:hypothetical protein HRI_002279700 [Hibiscus trionum]
METAIVPVTMPDTPITPTENGEPLSSEVKPNKRKRKKSIVWDYFTEEMVGDGSIRAFCNQCKKSFAYITGSKVAGTSHLKRHIALGICPVSRQRNQQIPDPKTGNAIDGTRKTQRATHRIAKIPFNQENCNHEMAKMIVMHEYPLHIVEHSGFIDFVRTIQPQFNMVSFNTIQGDCVTMYLKDKHSLLNFINEIPGRVSLALDLWISDQTVGYVFVRGQFIDTEWNLHRCLLNVVTVPSPDSDSAILQAVVSCLSDWHLEDRLFTLTLDQSSNESVNESLRALFSVRNPYVLHGQLLVGNCFARVISVLVQEALSAVGESVKKIRESVKFVKTSDIHEETFFHLKEQLKDPSLKDIFIDDQTKWNTTYDMLVAACELKHVFLCLETSIPDYNIAPSMDDWKQIEILCTYLKLFFDAVSILTAQTYPTASAFYHEVSKVQLELTHASMSNDPFISSLTKPLKEKFDRYWSDCFLVLAIAVVMDPRFKMKLVEFSFSRIYGDDAGMWIKIVDDGIHELYLEYTAQAVPPPKTFVEERNESSIHEEDGSNIPQNEHGILEYTAQAVPPPETFVEERNESSIHEQDGSNIPQNEHGILDYTTQAVSPPETFVEEQNESGIPEEDGSIINKNEHGILEYTAQAVPPPETFVEERNESSIHEEDGSNIPQNEHGILEYTAQAVSPPETFVEERNGSGIPEEDGSIINKNEHGILEYTIQAVPPPETFVEERNESGIPVEDGSINLKNEHPEEGYLQGLPEEGYLKEGPSQHVACHEMPHQGVASQEVPSQDPLISIADGLSDFEVYISEISGSQQTKSELDQYLEESLLPREQDFNILSWWKLNKTKYPILWRMASDILSIPFSTVSPDSVYDTERKKINNYHSSLRPVTLEALICAKDWLQYGGASQSSDAIVKMEF